MSNNTNMIIAAALGYIILWLAFICGVAYVAIHFVVKYW